MTTFKYIVALLFLLAGMFVFICSTFGVNRFKRALNRMHAAALGDTLGLLFVMVSLILAKGICVLSFKLFAVVVFFWLASPVASHMLARLEAETDHDLGEIEVQHR